MHRFLNGVRRFFYGRYGTDQLNMVILIAALIISLIGSITRLPLLNLLAWVPMGLALFRMMSKNTGRRYRENRRYLQIMDRIRDRRNRYFSCPACHQTVRVPRGKGKISIRCPRCGNKFIKKT